MIFRKYISAGLLLVFVFAQIAFAHHSTVHSDHGFSTYQLSYGDPHKSDKKTSHQCPECVLIKSLQTSFPSDEILISLIKVDVDKGLSFSNKEGRSYKKTSSNQSRAPPAILI